MRDRRNGNRKPTGMPITVLTGGAKLECEAVDLSPTGIRLHRQDAHDDDGPLCTIELHLVPRAISTAVTARRVWRDDDWEAYEFVGPSFAQQAMLERVLGNY